MRRLFLAPLLIALGLAANALGATSSFEITDAAVVQSGIWSQADFGAGQYNAAANDSEFAFVAHGTDCTFRRAYLNAAGDFKVSVDGGAFASIATDTPGNYGIWTLYAGLSDANHTVVVKSTGKPFGAIIMSPTNGGGIGVTGSAPALSAPAGYGPQRVLMAAGTVEYVAASPGYTATSSNGYSSLGAAFPAHDVQIDLPSGSCDTLKLWCFRAGQKYRLRVDGKDQPPVTCVNTQVWGWVTLATGLPTTGTHAYSVHQVYSTTSVWVYSAMTTGGSGLTGTTAAAAKECWAFYGDSITAGWAGTGLDSSKAYAAIIARAHGVWPANLGIDGACVWDSGGRSDSGQSRTAQLTSMMCVVAGTNTAIAPTKVVILYGVNDYLQVLGAETSATFTTATVTMLNAITAGLPSGQIYYLGLLDYKGHDLTAWRAAQATAAVTASPAVAFYRTEGLVNTEIGSGESVDNLHPTYAGYLKFAWWLDRLMTGNSAKVPFPMAPRSSSHAIPRHPDRKAA